MTKLFTLKKIFSLTLILSLSSPTSYADLKEEKIFNTTIYASTNSNMYKFSSTEYSASSDLGVNIEAKIPFAIIAGIDASVSKDFTQDREQKINDSTIYFAKVLFNLGQYIKFATTSSVVVPTSEVSRVEKGLRTAVAIGPSITFDLAMIGLKYVTFKYSPSFSKNFHKFTTDASNKMNTSYSIKNKFGLTYTPWDFLILASTLTLADTWSYRDTRRIPSFENRYSINANVTDEIGISLELVYGDSLYKANGHDTNYKLLNEEKGNISLGVSYAF
ncbi:MAG: hypothetical protein HQK51_09730 [Oligoflexia bacterium]|nr:hypothetical protein [Oligoflexia bacterium]